MPNAARRLLSKKRRRENNLTKAADDSDSDYSNFSPSTASSNKKIKLKFTSTPRAATTYAASATTSFPSPSLYSPSTPPIPTYLPTPPKISLFSKAARKRESESQSFSTTPSSSQDFGAGSPHSPFSFTPSTPTPSSNSSSRYDTRSQTQVPASPFIPSSSQSPTQSSGRGYSYARSSPNPFRTPPKNNSQHYSQPSTPTSKPSGIKLLFKLKSSATTNHVSFNPVSTIIPDTPSSQDSTSTYTPPIFGSGGSVSASRYAYTPSSQGNFGSALENLPPIEDTLASLLSAELDSDSESGDVPMAVQVSNFLSERKNNIDSDTSDFDSNSDSDPLLDTEPETATETDIPTPQEWHPSPALTEALMIHDMIELTETNDSLHLLRMQFSWAQRSGIPDSAVTGLEERIMRLDENRMSLEKKLLLLPANDDVNGQENGQLDAPVKAKKEHHHKSQREKTPTAYLHEDRNGNTTEKRGPKHNNSKILLNGGRPMGAGKRGDAAAAALGHAVAELREREGEKVRGHSPPLPQLAPANPFGKGRESGKARRYGY